MSNKAILLDRDDTLIEDPGYINHPSQVKLFDGVAEALIELRSLGYKLVVASNQSGVARGIVTEQVLGEIHDRLKLLLAEKGAYLDAIYYCPYHPEGSIPKYRMESDLRKPNPGMLLAAAKDLDLDLTQSWAIGNSDRDIEAGKRAGCKTILLDTPGRDRNLVPSLAKPDYRAVNLKEAVNIIKKYHRSLDKPVPQPIPFRVAEPKPSATDTVEPQIAEPQKIEQDEKSQDTAEEQPPATNRTEELFTAILDQLKSKRREEMFTGEFSGLRFLAGILQATVVFCLLVCVILLLSSKPPSSVLIALMFAMVFQLMSLTFYIINGRK